MKKSTLDKIIEEFKVHSKWAKILRLYATEEAINNCIRIVQRHAKKQRKGE